MTCDGFMNLSELQDKLFDVLCTVDDICNKNGLNYFIDSGTEIGAVREGDFIPWDDDADIKILAEDYPKFKTIMSEQLPPHLHIFEPWDFCPLFYDFVIRIYDDRYLVREKDNEDNAYNNMQNHVGVDVFLLARTSDKKIMQKFIFIKIKILYGLGMAHRYKIYWTKYSGLQLLQVAFLVAFGRFIDSKKITHLWFDKIVNCSRVKGNYRFTSNYQLKNIRFYPDEWVKSAKYFSIRGRKFPVPIGYDEELKLIYGDYMVPHRDFNLFVQHLR